MLRTDVAIVGGGLAGSAAAAMLGRAGIDSVLIDPHCVHPPELRCEKLDGSQVRILERTGLAPEVLSSATHDRNVWVARFGRLEEARASDQHGILYDTLVNVIRAAIPPHVPFIQGKASAVAASGDLQVVTLASGEEIAARLVVIANGLNIGIRHMLGMRRRDLSKCHSITIAFDMKPRDRPSFDFHALTYYAERHADRMAYLTLFPIGAAMRANLMVYRGMDDPWLRTLRRTPEAALLELMPRLRRLTGAFEVAGPVSIRPADLYVTENCVQRGVVLVGDAFATSCPAAGTGAGKVFTDVERLCNVYIPHWLATEGMGTEKIAAFYDDPAKRAYDAFSLRKASDLRTLSIDSRLQWHARRWARFAMRRSVWTVRRLRERLSSAPAEVPAGAKERATAAGAARTTEA